ncbi:MAG: hypothetical protein WCN98_01775 [Verrucomicrobiaceae bacterium]
MICLFSLTPDGQSADDVTPNTAHPIHVSVQLLHKSPVPDPKRSEYEDCLYTAKARVLEIQAGIRIEREIVILLPAFFKRRLQPEAAFSMGQVIEADVIPHGGADARRKQLQRSDDVKEFDLPLYDSLHARLVEKKSDDFAPQPDSYFASKEATAMPQSPVRHALSAKVVSERQSAIVHDKQEILKALKDHGGKWDAWQDSLQPFYRDLLNQVKASPDGFLRKGGCFFKSLRATGYKDLSDNFKSDTPGPLKMLISMSRQLRDRGIDLIVVPFPNKEDTNAEIFSKLAPADGWFLPYRQWFLLQLLEADVEVIDLIRPLREARSKFPSVFYDEHDHHPADGGIQVAAEQITRRLARYELAKDAKNGPIDLRLNPSSFLKSIDEKNEVRCPATQILTADGNPLHINDNTGSPVVILGDSFTQVPAVYPHSVEGAALPMHVAYLSGVVPDRLSNMGSSDKAMTLLAREGGDFLANRRVLVFVFAPNRLFGQDSGRGDEKWNLVNLPPLPLKP